MAAGVTIVDPASTWIGPDVDGRRRHGDPSRTCTSKAGRAIGARLRHPRRASGSSTSTVDDDVVDQQLLRDHRVARRHAARTIGPFAHVRPQSRVERERARRQLRRAEEDDARDRDRRRITSRTSATRRSATKVNIGAGTITCNYDGTHKHPTVIEDGAFIGSDTQLVAPVRVGKGAYVAAGSSITEDVPAGALGIARGKQVNKPGWVENARRKRRSTIGIGIGYEVSICAASSDTSATSRSCRS